MSVLEALVLGLLQEAAEFMPLSGSGHMVVMHHFLSFSDSNPQITLAINMGALLSILIACWHSSYGILREFVLMCWDIAHMRGPMLQKSKYRYYAIYVTIASVPACISGMLFGKAIMKAFGTIALVSLSFYASALIIFIGGQANRAIKRKIEQAGPIKALIIGLFQMAAIIPGITRSGTTLTGGLLCGIEKDEAFELSFLAAIPPALCSLPFELKSILATMNHIQIAPIMIGFAASVIVGLLSIQIFRKIVQKNATVIFSVYLACIASALIIIA